METQERELKPMPYACKKSQLQAWYLISGYNEKEIRLGINAIIADKRKISALTRVTVKNIRHDELKEFVKIFGLPEGFKKGKYYED